MGQVITRLHESDNGFTVERVQDVEPILKATHDLRTQGAVGSSEMRHAASLPMVLVEAYCNTNHIEFSEFMAHPKHVKAMLNDPALSKFRIWEGRV